MKRIDLRPVLIGFSLVLAGCDREPAATPPGAAPEPAASQRAASLTPSDERLAGLYVQSCRACHSVGAAGAPLTGDRAALDPRWEKGLAALRSSTIVGLNGMPAGGQCFSCTAQDYEALIKFMAGRESDS